MLVIVGVGCLLTLPLIIYGINVQSDDGATHVVWYSSFASQFWAGDLYPRWLADLNDGLGSPAFFYYPPVPYFITSFLKPLFPGDVNGIHQLGISASMSVILSGIFTWAWCREWTDDISAMIGGIAFMITPYHLVIDLYTRSSFAELWSFAWIPLILLFVHRLSRGSRWAFAGLAVSYALLIGTHLPTTLIFSLVPISYAWFVSDKGRRSRTIVLLAASMSLGVGLAAIYLYPAMTMQDAVFVDRMILGHFSYSNWLFVSNLYYEQDVDLRPIYRLFYVFVDLIVLITAAFFLVRKSEEAATKRIANFWLVVGIAAALMTTDLSRPVWSLVTTLQKVQFPWRFGVVLSISATALLVLAVPKIRQTISTAGFSMGIVVLFCIFLWIPFAAWGFTHYAAPVKLDDVVFKEKVIHEKRDQAEYRPRWSQTMDALDWNESKNEDEWSDKLEHEYESLIERTGARDPNVPRAAITASSDRVEVVSSRPREMRVRTAAPSASSLRILQFYYPGWQARLSDTAAPLDVRATEPDGLVSVNVPAGEHEIVVELAKTDAERIGQLSSAISAISLILYAVAVGGIALRRMTLSKI